MHTQDELNKAIDDLYNDYKDAIKDYKKGDLEFFYKINKIYCDGSKYTKDEVYYIGFNALILLENDIKNNKI